MHTIVVNVQLKNDILDPQGRAVFGALTRQNLVGLTDVRQGKQFILKFDEDINAEQLAQIHLLANELLSNPIIEEYTIAVNNES